MGFIPRSLAFVSVAVAQHEGFEALPGALEVTGGITAGAAEIADRLVGLVRDVYGDELACPVVDGELLCIAPVRLHSVASALWDEGRCGDLAIVAELGEASIEHEPARPGFVGDLEFDRAGTQIADERFAVSSRPLAPPRKVSLQSSDIIGELADELRAVPAFRGDGNGNRILVHIEANV